MTDKDSKPKSASLPTSWLIVLVRYFWTTLWRIMMSKLAPTTETGAYQRPNSQFRQQIKSADNYPYPPVANRYRLYVGLSCPWAHRTLIVRKLKGLEKVIDVCLVIPSPSQGGWIMKEVSENCLTLKQLYRLSKSNYQGRYTVPVLWDTETKTIVNNESAEIIVILNSEFNQFAVNPNLDLNPPQLRSQIEQWNEKIYHNINNGVYRCGFAQNQSAYELACNELFTTLNEIETHLSTNRYLCGEDLTLADVRLFTTLIRFDVVYFSLFKCSIKPIANYVNLSRYLQDIYNLNGIAETCDLKTVKQDYFSNLFPLNPGGIIPL